MAHSCSLRLGAHTRGWRGVSAPLSSATPPPNEGPGPGGSASEPLGFRGRPSPSQPPQAGPSPHSARGEEQLHPCGPSPPSLLPTAPERWLSVLLSPSQEPWAAGVLIFPNQPELKTTFLKAQPQVETRSKQDASRRALRERPAEEPDEPRRLDPTSHGARRQRADR